jgi:hypothetical protein
MQPSGPRISHHTAINQACSAAAVLCDLLDLLCDLQEGQGRPHLFCDMRIVDDQGKQQPNDGKAVGHLQVWQAVCGLWLV